MRNGFLALATFMAMVVSSVAQAVPVTGGMGPGGLEQVGLSSNLHLWLKADQLSAGSLGTWNDQSGKSNNAVAPSGAQQPTVFTNSLNSQPTVRFDGTDRILNLPAGLGTTLTTAGAGTGFIVFQNRGNSSGGTRNGGAWQFGNQNNSNHFGGAGAGGTADDFYDDFGNELRPKIGDVVTPTNPAIGPNLYTASSQGGTFTPRVDGVQLTSSATPTVFRPIPTIGGNKSTTYYNGDVAEVAVYNRVLNTAERVVVENYLSAKWGTTLLEGSGALDVYKGDDVANGNYDRDVFGIGALADGGTALSTGSAGFGMEVTDTLSNMEFLMAGHQMATNSLVPHGEGDRWSRVWYVDRTAVDGMTATFSFDFNNGGVGGDFDPVKLFELLYSEDNSLSFTTLDSIASVSGTTISFNLTDLQLLDGYYTLQISELPPIPEPSTISLFAVALGLMTLRRKKK